VRSNWCVVKASQIEGSKAPARSARDRDNLTLQFARLTTAGLVNSYENTLGASVLYEQKVWWSIRIYIVSTDNIDLSNNH
jgi:hypothetical protein